MKRSFFSTPGGFVVAGCLSLFFAPSALPETVSIRASTPDAQVGRLKEDHKDASLYGEVLGGDWASQPGDWAEYPFKLETPGGNTQMQIRYSRLFVGGARLAVQIDGKAVGSVELPSTGGWGEQPDHFRTAALALGPIGAGEHRLRLTATRSIPAALLPADPLLDGVGNRADKNSVGHGRNVALYTGGPSKFFYATHNLGDVFSAADGQTLAWFPDYVVVSPAPGIQTNVVLDQIQLTTTGLSVPVPAVSAAPPDGLREQRQVCVTADDVVVSRVLLTNPTDQPITKVLEVTGDCRESVDFRGGAGGKKQTRKEGNTVVLTDGNVFPNALPDGLTMVIGATRAPTQVDTTRAGAYRLRYEVTVAPKGKETLTLACAFDPAAATAKDNLARVLADKDPFVRNRETWKHFYQAEVPQFACSYPGLTELYNFRWFLLKFSMAGGNLGEFKYPVDLEGRQAFQTYCCYSAPFMAYDLNWVKNPQVGFGQLMGMLDVAYGDGRFPWYTTPREKHVHLDHPSGTGQSLLPWTAWQFYLIHGKRDLLAQLYPGMKKNVDWWLKDRDPDGNGLFTIDHQLETGMDDLHRRWKDGTPARYEAIDASSYTYLNLRAVADMARELGNGEDASRYAALAQKTAAAVKDTLWNAGVGRYEDRNPDNGELSDYNSLTIFYPLFAGLGSAKQEGEQIRRYLLNPAEYWTPYPVPALSQTDPEFDPAHRYWAGLTWPATNSHVMEGLAAFAKKEDRSLLPQAAQLFEKLLVLHLRPRPDFYEHYHPLTGQPLSDFRDYMHSWWIDTIIRHAAGLMVAEDGGVTIDALPLGLKWWSLRGAEVHGHLVDVAWQEGRGLSVDCDGKPVLREAAYRPGDKAITVPATVFR